MQTVDKLKISMNRIEKRHSTAPVLHKYSWRNAGARNLLQRPKFLTSV